MTRKQKLVVAGVAFLAILVFAIASALVAPEEPTTPTPTVQMPTVQAPTVITASTTPPPKQTFKEWAAGALHDVKPLSEDVIVATDIPVDPQKIEVDQGGRRVWVTYRLKGFWDENQLLKDTALISVPVVTRLFSAKQPREVVVDWKIEFIDANGNTSWDSAVRSWWHRKTVAKLNPKGFTDLVYMSPEAFYKRADSYFIEPVVLEESDLLKKL